MIPVITFIGTHWVIVDRVALEDDDDSLSKAFVKNNAKIYYLIIIQLIIQLLPVPYLV
jgi:hypothetical protein